MIVLSLGLALLIALALIPLGLPGTWLMLLAGFVAMRLLPPGHLGWVVLGACLAIAVVAEILDLVFAAKYTKRYGGSSRGMWGAVIGGLVGAIVGVPIPVIGSVLGAIVGSFGGALIAEVMGGAEGEQATRAATGAAIGRAVAMAFKVTAGLVIATVILAAAVL